jgi:MFS transporter, DHA1 family, inner membrane transport protein
MQIQVSTDRPARASLTVQTILFVFTRMVMNINGRMVYPFLSVFARGLGVDLTVISLGLTARSAVTVLSPFAATIADQRGRKPVILVCVAICFFSAVWLLLFPGLPTFIAFLCLTYFSIYTAMSAIQAYLGDLVPYEKRGKYIALLELGWALSFILGMPVIALLIDRYGWLAPFPLLAVLELIIFILLTVFIPSTSPQASNTSTSAAILKRVFSDRSALSGLVMNLLLAASCEMVMLVFGIWMEDSFGLALTGLGLASAVIGASEFSGELTSAFVSDRLGKKRAVLFGGIFFGITSLLLPWLGQSLAGALVGLALFFISFEITFVSGMPLMSEVIPEARATMMSTNLAAVSLGRALAALAATAIYSLGFRVNTYISFALIVLALFALSQIQVKRARA